MLLRMPGDKSAKTPRAKVACARALCTASSSCLYREEVPLSVELAVLSRCCVADLFARRGKVGRRREFVGTEGRHAERGPRGNICLVSHRALRVKHVRHHEEHGEQAIEFCFFRRLSYRGLSRPPLKPAKQPLGLTEVLQVCNLSGSKETEGRRTEDMVVEVVDLCSSDDEPVAGEGRAAARTAGVMDDEPPRKAARVSPRVAVARGARPAAAASSAPGAATPAASEGTGWGCDGALHFSGPAAACDIPRKIALEGSNEYLVGRELEESSDFRFIFLDSAQQPNMISRQHALLSRSSERNAWCVTDLGSTNGLILNGRRTAQSELAEGDVLTFGGAKKCEMNANPAPTAKKSIYTFTFRGPRPSPSAPKTAAEPRISASPAASGSDSSTAADIDASEAAEESSDNEAPLYQQIQGRVAAGRGRGEPQGVEVGFVRRAREAHGKQQLGDEAAGRGGEGAREARAEPSAIEKEAEEEEEEDDDDDDYDDIFSPRVPRRPGGARAPCAPPTAAAAALPQPPPAPPLSLLPHTTSAREAAPLHADAPPAPTPAQPATVEVGLEEGVPCGKLYPDLRALFVRRLWDRARTLRFAASNKAPLDATVRAMQVVALWPHALRSADAALSLPGIGPELCDCLRGKEAEGNEGAARGRRGRHLGPDHDSHGPFDEPADPSHLGGGGVSGGRHGQGRGATGMMEVKGGMVASAAAAALVALLEFTEAKEEERARLRELGERVAEEAPVCSLEDLICQVAPPRLALSPSAAPLRLPHSWQGLGPRMLPGLGASNARIVYRLSFIIYRICRISLMDRVIHWRGYACRPTGGWTPAPAGGGASTSRRCITCARTWST